MISYILKAALLALALSTPLWPALYMATHDDLLHGELK